MPKAPKTRRLPPSPKPQISHLAKLNIPDQIAPYVSQYNRPPSISPTNRFSPTTVTDCSPAIPHFVMAGEQIMEKPIRDEAVEAAADPTYPSPYEFEKALYDYTMGFDGKKREKVLMTTKLYDAIMHQLMNPKDTSKKTANFRWWCKKTFNLCEYEGEVVLCQEGRPVAVREKLFEILLHCHANAGHGGRDKTSYQIKFCYSYIPKDIISAFVGLCPTCAGKKTLTASSLSDMSEPQAFLINLQSADWALQNKQPISLAAAKAAACSQGYMPRPQCAITAANGKKNVHLVKSKDQIPANAIHYPNNQVVYSPSPQEIQDQQNMFNAYIASQQTQAVPQNATAGPSNYLAHQAPQFNRSQSYTNGEHTGPTAFEIEMARNVSQPVYSYPYGMTPEMQQQMLQQQVIQQSQQQYIPGWPVTMTPNSFIYQPFQMQGYTNPTPLQSISPKDVTGKGKAKSPVNENETDGVEDTLGDVRAGCFANALLQVEEDQVSQKLENISLELDHQPDMDTFCNTFNNLKSSGGMYENSDLMGSAYGFTNQQSQLDTSNFMSGLNNNSNGFKNQLNIASFASAVGHNSSYTGNLKQEQQQEADMNLFNDLFNQNDNIFRVTDANNTQDDESFYQFLNDCSFTTDETSGDEANVSF